MNLPPPLRVVIPLVLVGFGMLAGLAAYLYDRGRQSELIEQSATERLQFLGTKLGSMGSFMLEMDLLTGTQREVTLTAMSPGVRYAMILDADDKVAFSSRYDERGLPLARSSAAGAAALIGDARKTSSGRSAISADRMRVTGAYPFPILTQGRITSADTGVVVLEIDLSFSKAEAAQVELRRTQIGFTSLLGLTLIFTLVFHRVITSRVRRLVNASAELARGNLSARAALTGGDELALLSQSFDSMTEQLRARDAALLESEQRFRQMAENVDEIFWLYDFTSGNALFVNPAFERVFGRPVSDILESTKVWHDAIHPEDRERVMAEFRTEREGPRETEYRITRPDGTVRWLRDRAFPVASPDGTVTRVAGIAQDITARRQAAAEKATFERKLGETQRLESLGVLAGGIAHDFNNLLTGVLGNASLARMHLEEAHECQKFLAEIEEVAVRAADLCKQMLAYSGKGRFELQLLDLSAIVRETTQLLRLSIAKNSVLRFNLSADIPPIEADATQIRQVVMNLVINASEALGGKSGTISLTTGLVRVDQDYIRSTVLAEDLAEGDYTFLEVADNGSGMSAETQARIFEPFFTTKFTGRGLGLSAVLGIVRGHSGAMKVYSEAGKGTMFKLMFPVAKGVAEPATSKASADRAWRGSGTVMVVDDEETVRAVGARMLEAFGFKVVLAADGSEAVDAFKAEPEKFRAVIMDLTMPHMDGAEAFRRMRGISPNVRVILMSGFNEQEAINRFTGKGLSGFLQKPFKPAELAAKLRVALDAPEPTGSNSTP